MNFQNNPLEDLHRLTAAVKAAGADIAPTYLEYMQMAFAIATDCGEAGRTDFISLCSLSAKYDADHAGKLFSNAVRSNKNNIHLGTVFHLAEQCGVKVDFQPSAGAVGAMGAPPKSHTRAHVRETDFPGALPGDTDSAEKLIEGSEPYSPLPGFPQDYQWPEFLQRILSFGATPEQRDVLFISALTVLGSSLGRILRCLYSRKWQSPCMQAFVIAPSASGKSVTSWVRLLVEPIHDEIRRQVAEEMKQYRQEKAAYDSLGKKRQAQTPPVMPLNRMFIISGNNTGTGILQNIMDSGGTGIICESEADTVSAAIGTEYGNWSDTLRKAFDQDRLSYNRRTDHEYREVKKSYLSVLLSGTPAQVKPLIPSAENGLFSRQIFYYMPAVSEWMDQFYEVETDVDEEFRSMGQEWKAVVDRLRMQGVFTLHFTEEQKKSFNKLFRALFHRSRISNGSEMNSSVVRLAVNTCRIMSVVAMLRSLEVPSLMKPDEGIATDNLKDGIITRWNLSITEEDFRAVLALVEPLYSHATHILSFLSATEVTSRSTADKDLLFAAMETEFTRKHLLEKAHEMGIPEETASCWLKRLSSRGALVSVDGRGTYCKS